MSAFQCLKTWFANLFANVFEERHQGCVGRNGLPFAQYALRVDNLAGEHGAAVHRELQDVNRLLAAIHFHVRASGHKICAALRLLGCFVIEQTPKRAVVAGLFDGAIVNVDGARIVGDDFLPFGMCGMRGQQHQHTDRRCDQEFHGTFLSLDLGIHAPYYKVVHRS